MIGHVPPWPVTSEDLENERLLKAARRFVSQ